MRAILFAFLLLLIIQSNAQERCGTVSPNPEIFENWIQSKMNSRKQKATEDIHAPVHEIPVVVHIIEPASGGSLNISNERVFRQIEILNEDFRRTNTDASNTPAAFLPFAADTEIQFSLAKQDPMGNPTNGIVRVRGTRDQYSALNHQALLRSESYWPPQHYLNIFVTDLFFFLGYASFPVSDLEGINDAEGKLIWDGVVIDHRYFGDNPDAPSFESLGRTTTHEVGHYLGLRHIWGDGGCGIDDFVDDTPEADKSNAGLSNCTFPSNDGTVCDTDEMFQNYMDYTDDGCMNLFTEGQKTRMRTIIENAPRRLSLLTSPALNDPPKVANDLAIKSILSPNYFECDNSISPQIEVINAGSNTITTYDIQLSIDGVITQTVNQISILQENETEVVSFTNEFIFSNPATILFEIINVNGGVDNNLSNNTSSVTLTSTEASAVPYLDNFEGTPTLLGEFGSSFPWQLSNAPNESPANTALQFKSFQNSTAFGEQTIIRTPVFDMTGINSAELRFSYSYSEIPDSFRDGLAVKVSTDCGSTFSSEFVFNSYGPDLATTSSTTPFTPSDQMQWRDTAINITQYINTDGLQFAFIGQNGSANNIFLDNVAVSQTNLKANDIGLIDVEAPLLTCRLLTGIDLNIRNVGFQEITSITYEYEVEGTVLSNTIENLSLVSGETDRIDLDIELEGGSNDITFSITAVNGVADEDLTNNEISLSINRDEFTDAYPLLVDFETANFWEASSESESQLWSQIKLPSSNRAMEAAAFTSSEIGTQSWFISPALNVGELDTAGLSFKVSYAERVGFNDNLRVLMSVNCGETYSFELFNADSDSLSVTQSDNAWTPQSETDWQEFKVDLKPSIAWREDIRIAFVFTNGNGNNLFLDDINIGYIPEQIQTGNFTIFPNPSDGPFNVAFDLPERDNVEVQLMDVSGRVIFTKTYENVLDQVFDFEALSLGGFYFIKITGKQINQTERLYIRR